MIFSLFRLMSIYNFADLSEDSTLNREAAKMSGLPEGENFTMDKFSYNNSVVVSQMFRHLENTFFSGISVSRY